MKDDKKEIIQLLADTKDLDEEIEMYMHVKEIILV